MHATKRGDAAVRFYQLRAIQSSRWGRSVPMVVLRPWPGRTTVSSGSAKRRSRIESMIVAKSDSGQPVRPGPPGKRVSPVSR